MEKEEYKILVKKHSPKENRLKNIGVAFFVGGCIGFVSEFLVEFLKVSFGMNNADAGLWDMRSQSPKANTTKRPKPGLPDG